MHQQDAEELFVRMSVLGLQLTKQFSPAAARNFMRKYLHLTGLAALLLLPLPEMGSQVALAQVQLPTLGDRISGLISLDDEHALGKEFLRTVRCSTITS